ncbi:MAG: c-type cytochrome [Planctomycetaceae bacterium]|nr:c-type cytochrome [Planctomycetaceae bacterium]
MRSSKLLKKLISGFVFAVFAAITGTGLSIGQERIPHAQDKPPGPALSPEEAIARMTVPDGFTVELIASEPELVNPVAMTFDERGRVWVTESLEYPRMSAGEGRDRIRILEDTDHDGRMDKFTTFAEGLNIPSGIAVGYGGVWVANSPDILFLEDTDGDDKADRKTVVVTGFGRFDTHELPNSLTWGPDGWLYGLNGVFNRSVVQDPVTGQTFDFTCALFRINPRTHEFNLFAEGTSNPWGIAWNPVGDPFLSACVIDHLWHLTETGYYHRQGGPYPPFTWKAESIVSHKHQKAAYCGITYFDSDAYPKEYRDRLMMGNIHGNCINVDILHERDSTYQASPAEDFLSAHDAWFMPVVQKTGPDGCLWVLDWYDRYHCYQDARRDPDGIDRLKGRLYRIRFRDTPRAGAFDLRKESNARLIERLHQANVHFREIAQRLLSERDQPEANTLLEQLVLDDARPFKTRMHALWARLGARPLSREFLKSLLACQNADVRAWGIRAAGNQRINDPEVAQLVAALRYDQHPRVRLQVAIAAGKIEHVPTVSTLVDVLAQAGKDPLVPRIVWQNLHPLLESQTEEFTTSIASLESDKPAAVIEILPRVADRLLAAEKPDTAAITQLVSLLLTTSSAAESADRALQILTQRIRSGELSGDSLDTVRQTLSGGLTRHFGTPLADPLTVSSLELATSAGISEAKSRAAALLDGHSVDGPQIRLLNALITAGDRSALPIAASMLSSGGHSYGLRRTAQAIGRIPTFDAVTVLLEQLNTLPEDVQPAVIEALTDRTDAAIALMTAVADGKVVASTINANQARKMLSLKEERLTDLINRHWGIVRSQRDPARARLISQMRNTLRTSAGNPVAGQAVFRKVCAQCHKIYGEGADVGPDITRNGRASFEQLLSNVFDPSLVIGSSYQALTVVTNEGRVVTGLPIEDSPQRVTLKVQGDKMEVIARSDIDEVVRSELSLMPEGLEKQLKPEELIDLFAYLTLTGPPDDPNARPLPGARIEEQSSNNPPEFTALVADILPGFATEKSGVDGVAVLSNYNGRPALRTHPVSRNEPCRLHGSMTVPDSRKPVLRVSIAADHRGDWQLVVRINGTDKLASIIRSPSAMNRWKDIEIDLSEYRGQTVRIELLNKANDWSYEFGYWNAVEMLAE